MNYVILTLILLVLLSVVAFDYLKRRYKIKGIIAGDVTIPQGPFPDKYVYSLNNYKINDKTIRAKDFPFIGYLNGSSLEKFGLPDGTVVFCEKANFNDIKKDDILILKTSSPPNEGKPKGRRCLGTWGNPDQPDDDLIQYEGHKGSVKEYLAKVAPERYGHIPYTKQIEGFLKTISCDLQGNNLKIKVSRPHNPQTVIARVQYALLKTK